MKDPLRRFVIAVTGDFGEHRSHDKIKAWIQKNGGSHAQSVTPDVTHLVCSISHYKNKVSMVEAAKALKNVKIVTFDWLEDSLMKRAPMSSGPYLMRNCIRAKASKKAKKGELRSANIRQGMELFERQCQEFTADMKTDGYEIYRDPSDGFPYDVTLARANLLLNENERYQLKLYSTHSVPKMFACYVKHSTPGQSHTSEVLALPGSSFDIAWFAFQKFFKLKTGKEWNTRFLESEDNKDAFKYYAPKHGEPTGMFLGMT